MNVQFVVGTPSQQQHAPQITQVQAPTQQQQQTDQQYWARVTSFGRGSTAQTCDVDGIKHRQIQEEQATRLLQAPVAYINPRKD